MIFILQAKERIDDIGPRVLKELGRGWAGTTIFRASLNTGELPEDWRQANDTDIQKKAQVWGGQPQAGVINGGELQTTQVHNQRQNNAPPGIK